MRKLYFLFAIALSLIVGSAYAQQPFEGYGYKVKVATMSNGKYNEFFDQDTIVQIGTVAINRLTGKIVSFVSYDTTYSEATLQPELVSRWMSPDPLAHEYFSYSPYNFVLNNPVNAIDPDGQKVIFVNGYWNRVLNYMGMAPGAPKEAYWNFFDRQFIGAARDFMGAGKNESNHFVDASSIAGFDTDGADRYALGRSYAEKHYDQLIEGMEEGEAFRIVGHSEGSAFAAGMAEYLNERWGLAHSPNHLVTDMLYLSPDEVEDFNAAPGIQNSNQLHYDNDPVASAKPLKGAQYTELKGKKMQYAHGGTVTKGALQKLQNLLTAFVNSGDVEKVETADGTTYRRKD